METPVELDMKLEVVDLQKILDRINNIAHSWDVNKKRKDFRFLIQYVVKGDRIIEYLLGNPILKDLLNVIDFITHPSKDQDYIVYCKTFLNYLLELGQFFSDKSKEFLPSNDSPHHLTLLQNKIKKSFRSLDIPDACFFLDLLSKDLDNFSALSGFQISGLLCLFCLALQYGLLDKIIAVLVDQKLCAKPCIPFPSTSFPYPESRDLVEMINNSFSHFMKSLENLKEKTDYDKCRWDQIIKIGLADQFYGRFRIFQRTKKL